jgi:hypothetical protein
MNTISRDYSVQNYYDSGRFNQASMAFGGDQVAYNDTSAVEKKSGEVTGFSPAVFLENFGSGEHEVSGTDMQVTKPGMLGGIFGNDSYNGDGSTGSVSMRKDNAYVDIDATVNDKKGYSYPVQFSAVGINEEYDGHGQFGALITVGGESYNGKMIPIDKNQVFYLYKDDQGNSHRISLKKDESTDKTSLQFSPPYATSSVQDGNAQSSIKTIEF